MRIQEQFSNVAGEAMEFDDGAGNATRVSPSTPLPVAARDAVAIAIAPATGTTTLFSIDTTGYQSVVFALNAAGAGSVVFEMSNDGVTWYSTYALVVGGGSAGGWYQAGSATSVMYQWPVSARFFQVRVSSYSSGTIGGAAQLRQVPMPVKIDIALAASSNTIGNVAINGATAAGGNNGQSLHRLISAASTNATSVKTSAGRISGGVVTNVAAGGRYLKFYNKAVAPTVGTDVPILTIAIPPNWAIGLADVFSIWGLYFSVGIAYAITGGAADGDTTAIGVGDVLVCLAYA